MKNILYIIISLAVMHISFACSEHDRYETSVVRQFELSLNGKPWALNTGISTKPVFIYKAEGDFFSNYSSHYRFQLENGSYKFVATPNPTGLIPDSIIATNLNNLIIHQAPNADLKVEISAAVDYSSPFSEILKLDMLSRTGTLRLRATDTKADKSYTTVRTVITAQRSGYRVIDETYIETPIDIIRSKATVTGGINYTDDFIVFKTKDDQNGLKVRFELLDKNAKIVQTKELAFPVPVWADTITVVDFKLNDTDNPIIQDYTVSILTEDWTDEELNPAPPFIVPDGYTYVAPTDDIQSVYNEMAGDASITEIKLYLKADATYNLGRITVSKSLSILGQTPKDGETKAVLNFGINNIEGDMDYINIEGLDVKAAESYLFNLNSTSAFYVKDITLRGCYIDNIVRNIFRGQASTADLQFIDNFIIDDVRMLNLAIEQNYSTISMANGNPIRNIVINNTTMHVLGTGLRNSYIGGTRGQTESMTVTMTNSTFIREGNANITIFDLRADGGAPTITVTCRNNLFSGISVAGQGRWMYLSGNTVKDITNNYYTNDFVMSNWGVDTSELPIATVAKDALFNNVATGDLTIKDKTSAVYTNRIGDPRWLD
ncbi:DUF5123 domain-containing protein [Dysgonomonas reticulitermitis]